MGELCGCVQLVLATHSSAGAPVVRGFQIFLDWAGPRRGWTLRRPWADFRPTLGRPSQLWADFGATLGATLDKLWVDIKPTLGRLWADFGPTLV